MLRKTKNNKGYTLIELVLVITILGLMAAVALPHFTSMTASASTQVREHTVGALNSSLQLYRADRLAKALSDEFPPALDTVPVNFKCSVQKPCFGLVMSPVEDGSWNKVADNKYEHTVGTEVIQYEYAPATGKFAPVE